MVTHIGLATLLLRTLHSQILGYAHRFVLTCSSHAHKTRKRFCHVRWIPKRRSHNHKIHRRSWSCTFTNSAVTNSVIAYAPVYEHRTRKRSSHERRTRKRPVTHSGHTNSPVTYARFPDAAVTTLVSLTLLVGLHWIGWIDYIGFTNAAISLVGYWLDYIGLVGLITLVSQALLSRWLAIGWITLDWLDCLHWFHKRCYLVGWLLIGLHWIDYIGFTDAAISIRMDSQTLLSLSQTHRGCCQANWTHRRWSRTPGHAYRTR